MGIIEEVLNFNKDFVAKKGYEAYVTDKFPAKKLAVLSCMDTRLSTMLTSALGLKNGDAKIIKNAGAVVIGPYDSAMRSLIVAVYELGVEEIMVVAHSNCGACHMSFDHFHKEMLKKGIDDKIIDAIIHSGIDLVKWLDGFHDTEQSVKSTVEIIKSHPLMPSNIVVKGFIIDSTTGELTAVV